MIVRQDGLALSWILLQTLYISLSQGTKLFSLKARLFLSGFKGTGNWLPFLSQERNTHCIKNDNSIQQYTSNWIPRKIRNLTVHIRKVLRFCPIWANFKILNKENVLLIVYYSNSFLKFKLKYQRRFESSYTYSEKATKFCEISTVDFTITT